MKIKKSSLEQVSEETGGAYISSRFRNPQDEVAASDGKDTPFGIVAIIATLIMIAVAVVLYLNLDFFQQTGLFIQ